jgi:hypothetical protein
MIIMSEVWGGSSGKGGHGKAGGGGVRGRTGRTAAAFFLREAIRTSTFYSWTVWTGDKFTSTTACAASRVEGSVP